MRHRPRHLSARSHWAAALPAAVLVAAALLAAPAAAAPPGPAEPARLALVERQVLTLEFTRPVARLAVSDPDLLALEAAGTRLRLTAQRAGRASLEVTFDDGAVAAWEVAVAPLRRAPAAAAPEPGEVVLAVGEARRLPAPGLAQVLLEENGVAGARAEAGAVVVTGLAPGRSSVVLVDGAGTRTTVPIRVR